MNLIDRLRIRGAVIDYDFWMDIEGVTGHVRRERRRELHANLLEATEDVGYAAARRQLGSLRALAAEGRTGIPGPRWAVGSWWAVGVFALVSWSVLLMSTTWIDGALAAGVDGRRVEGSPAVMPWVHAFVDHSPGQNSFGVSVSPLVVIVPMAVAFLLGSRAWRLLSRRPGRSSAPAPLS